MELQNVEPGRIILVERRGYDHYGIYAGDGQVIHYAPMVNGGEASIHKANIRNFLTGNGEYENNRFYVPYMPQNQADIKALIEYHKQTRSIFQGLLDELFNMYNTAIVKVYTAIETLKRALNSIGEKMYSLLDNNCEHFAFWCKFQVKISNQIGRIYKIFDDLIIRNVCQRYHNYVICP